MEPTSEAPLSFHFWTAVWTVAGALRRRVMLKMPNFEWKPNFYIALVSPPGIVSKTTTIGIGERILRKVDGIHIGSQSGSWQKLIEVMTKTTSDVGVEFNDGHVELITYSPLSVAIGELGTFLKMEDKGLMEVLIPFWDSVAGAWSHDTYIRGLQEIHAPCLNMIGCTTPDWITKHFPPEMIGGGLASRFIFVHGEKKSKLIAYPDEMVDSRTYRQETDQLIEDLSQIAELSGEYRLSPEARDFGREWYENFWTKRLRAGMDSDRYEGYFNRKQTHMHKLALVLTASRSDERIITRQTLQDSLAIMNGIEPQIQRVFDSIGATTESKHSDTVLSIVRANGWISHDHLWRQVRTIMDSRNFKIVIETLVKTSKDLNVVPGPDGKLGFALTKDLP